MNGAAYYVVYGNKCGTKNRYKKIKKVTALNYTQKKLKKGTYYKFIIVALDENNNVISISKMVHAATPGGKVGNHKAVTTKAKKNKVTIKKGKAFKLRARAVPKSKKLKVKIHRGTAYESTDTKVATVSKKGVIKAKAKGTCYVYAYVQSGICKRIKVTVR